MVCLEDFYKETGMSRSFLSRIINVSEDTLKKYEWSDTDRMRQSTIDKIENGVHALSDIYLKVECLHFGNGWTVYWTSDGIKHEHHFGPFSWPEKAIAKIAGLP